MNHLLIILNQTWIIKHYCSIVLVVQWSESIISWSYDNQKGIIIMVIQPIKTRIIISEINLIKLNTYVCKSNIFSPERLLVLRCPQGLSVRTYLEKRESVIDHLSVQPGKSKFNKWYQHYDEKKPQQWIIFCALNTRLHYTQIKWNITVQRRENIIIRPSFTNLTLTDILYAEHNKHNI